MARQYVPADGTPVYRVLAVTKYAEGSDTSAYGPYATPGAAKGQARRLRREHQAYDREGLLSLTVQSSAPAWEDVTTV